MKLLPTLQIRQGRSMAHPLGVTEVCPRNQVVELLDHGFQRITFVDVDAAQGKGNNRECIADLMRLCRSSEPRICIQVGGGIRSSDLAQFYLDHGATWLLVGTLLHHSPMALDQLLARFHEHLTAAIDVRNGAVRAAGRLQAVPRTVEEVAAQLRSLQFRRILFVDVPDGEAPAPNFHTAHLILKHARSPLLMWSSFRNLDDLAQAGNIPGLSGVQVDAAFVLGQAEALRAYAGARLS